MKTIRCKCGKKILVLPELKEMNKAIEKHVAEHRTKLLMKGVSKAKALAEGAHIRHLLAQQVLRVVTKKKK